MLRQGAERLLLRDARCEVSVACFEQLLPPGREGLGAGDVEGDG